MKHNATIIVVLAPLILGCIGTVSDPLSSEQNANAISPTSSTSGASATTAPTKSSTESPPKDPLYRTVWHTYDRLCGASPVGEDAVTQRDVGQLLARCDRGDLTAINKLIGIVDHDWERLRQLQPKDDTLSYLGLTLFDRIVEKARKGSLEAKQLAWRGLLAEEHDYDFLNEFGHHSPTHLIEIREYHLNPKTERETSKACRAQYQELGRAFLAELIAVNDLSASFYQARKDWPEPRSVELLRKLISDRHPPAVYFVGKRIVDTEWSPALAELMTTIESLADQEIPAACHVVGRIKFASGREKDRREAAVLFSRAARQGVADAWLDLSQFYFGAIYHGPKYVGTYEKLDRDDAKAMYCIQRAKELGSEAAEARERRIAESERIANRERNKLERERVRSFQDEENRSGILAPVDATHPRTASERHAQGSRLTDDSVLLDTRPLNSISESMSGRTSK